MKVDKNRMIESKDLLARVNIDADMIYLEHEQGKDNCCPKFDSWRDMTDWVLVDKLDEEFGEFKMSLLQTATSRNNQYKELLDVINVLKMIGAKMILEKENDKRK